MAKVLLTGATSFTGAWIAEALADAGHHVVAPLLRAREAYQGLRADRLQRLLDRVEVVFERPFASPGFHDLLASGVDVLAHHAADIPGYREPTYDVAAGVARNLQGGRQVFAEFARHGGRAVIATGTGFEAAGDPPRAVSPYGLSKHLTNQAFRHYAHWEGLAFGRFVINGPFGPLEEGRIVWSLFQAWFAGQAGVIRTPAYVRDNIPVPLLARAYAGLVEDLVSGDVTDRDCKPAGFIGPQIDFARRVAAEAAPRLGLACAIEALEQTAFPEPYVVANTEPTLSADWDQAAFWDAYVDYYRQVQARGLLGRPA